MTVDIHTLETEALQLSPNLRARLAESLLRSLESLSDAEIERLWLDEAQRRDAEMTAGSEPGLPAEDALRRARDRHS